MTVATRRIVWLSLVSWLGAVSMPSIAAAQAPAIPSLLPLKKPKKSKKKPKKVKKKKKATGDKKTSAKSKKRKGRELALEEELRRLLSDFRKTQRFTVEGPGTFVIDITRSRKKPKFVKFVVVLNKKKVRTIKIGMDPISERIEVPAGPHTFQFIALPKRKHPGEVTMVLKAPGRAVPEAPAEEEKPPLVAAASEPVPASSSTEVPPLAPPPDPAAEAPALSPLAPSKPTAVAAKVEPEVKVLGSAKTYTLGGGSTRRSYHLITAKAPLSLKLQGPGTLWLELRRNLGASGTSRSGRMALRAILDKELLVTRKLRSMASTDRYKETGQVRPAAAEHIQIAVPKGDHTCELKLDSRDTNGATVALDLGKDGRQPIVLVKDGTYLSRIAQTAFGREDFWPAIYEFNRDIIGSDPNRVEVGTKLFVPSIAEAREVMKWVDSGRPDPMPEVLARSAATGGNASPFAMTGPSGSDPIRRYVDDAVNAKVQVYLHAMVESGAMQAAELEVKMQPVEDLEIVALTFLVDGTPVETIPGGKPGELRSMDLLPGAHRLEASARVRGSGGVFSYMSSQQFDIKGSRGLFAQSGKNYRALISVQQGGGWTDNFKDRLNLQIDLQEQAQQASRETHSESTTVARP